MLLKLQISAWFRSGSGPMARRS